MRCSPHMPTPGPTDAGSILPLGIKIGRLTYMLSTRFDADQHHTTIFSKPEPSIIVANLFTHKSKINSAVFQTAFCRFNEGDRY